VTDTSTEAVERLAAEYRPTMPVGVVHAWGLDAAATLRALAAERDAAREALRLMVAAYALDGYRDRGLEHRAHEAAAAALGESTR
jgi:hypothetical protein